MKGLFDVTVLDGCKAVIHAGRYVADSKRLAEDAAFNAVLARDAKFVVNHLHEMAYVTRQIGWVACNTYPIV